VPTVQVIEPEAWVPPQTPPEQWVPPQILPEEAPEQPAQEETPSIEAAPVRSAAAPVEPDAPLPCDQCGAPMSAEDIFCGECGAVSQTAAQQFSQPRDTVVIERLEAARESEDLVVAEDSIDEPEPEAEPVPTQPPVPEPQPVPAEPPVPEPQPAEREQAPFADGEDVESTRIVSRALLGERFVLQFSTGESFTVHGTGLIGRNPVPEPGEYVDEVVRVIDPSRSVSKTHLEFGQESGAFWILDRFSGNGTIVREPDTPALRCQPERRYRVARGTRIEIGEQFFIVS
jgi:hypothetical protein